MHILLTIWALDSHFIPDSGYDYDFIVFYITFSTSVVSSTFGITNFLKSGPCRILPKNGFCGGFPLVMLSIGSTFVGKAAGGWAGVVVWTLSNILPQVIHVSTH